MSTTGPRHPELAGRVAVVTGAAKGIGQGIAHRLATEGMRIVAADLDATALASTVEALRDLGAEVVGVGGDLSRDDDIDELFRHTDDAFGAVDVLVNNAADLERRRVLDEHTALLDLQLASNVRGPYLCSLRAARAMATSGGGSIVNISSVGSIRAHHRGLPYDVTKGAIDAMTRAMAVDLGEYGIRVNAVAPGVTHTYRTDPHVGSPSYRATRARIPLRRFGTVADIAAAVAFLASDDASYITGQVLFVDGGITTQLSPSGAGALEPDDDGDLEPKPAAGGRVR
jgi:3-oxoacyl-[acyl-carrier protein] reductase